MQLFFLGDIHGEWEKLFRKLDYYGIRDVILICVGDVGIGFQPEKDQLKNLEFLNNRFKKRGIDFRAIRGNHDDPAYFKGNYVWSNIKLLKDYTTFDHNGEKILLVGGGISIDRNYRKPYVSWWPDEAFNLKPEEVEKCDILVTHSAPSWLGPFNKNGIVSFTEKDVYLWDDCVKERGDHDKLLELAEPKYLYCGHFHQSETNTVNGCKGKILDILEIYNHVGNVY